MARTWMAGDEYTDSRDGGVLNGLWDTLFGTVTVGAAYARSGVNGSRVNPVVAGTHYREKVITFAGGDFRFGFAIQPKVRVNVLTEICLMAGTVSTSMRSNPDGTLELWDDLGGVQIGLDSPVLSLDQWYWINFTYIDATDTATIKINGTAFASGVVTGPGQVEAIDLGIGILTPATGEFWFDDHVFNDSTGVNETGDPEDQKIVLLRPRADGDSADGLRGGADSGSDWGQLDENPPNDIADYYILDAIVIPDRIEVRVDLATLLIPAGSTIKALQVYVRHRSALTGAMSYRAILKSQFAGIRQFGNAIIHNDITWKTNGDVFPRLPSLTSYTDPQAGGPWTIALLDNVQVGVEAVDASPNIWITALAVLVSYVPPPPPPPPPEPSLPVPQSLPSIPSGLPCDTGRGRSVGNFVVRVIYDPLGSPVDLSDCLVAASPLTQEKDIVLRNYKASDCELEFVDLESRFVDQHSAGFLVKADGTPVAFGKAVDVELYLDGALKHTYRGFVIGVRARAGRGILRLGNRLQSLFQQQMLANDGGRIISTTNVNGTPSVPPTAGKYVADVDVNLGARCRIETWTFTFLNLTQFDVVGSITGPDGSGDVGVAFTSTSGAITVQPAYWIGGPFVAGERTSIRTVWRAAATTLTTIQLLREVLLSAQGGQLATADIDASIAARMGGLLDQPISNGYVVDQEDQSAIDIAQNVALHSLAVVIEKASAKVGLFGYQPILDPTLALDILCKSDDLMDADTDRTPVYTTVVMQYDYDEVAAAFQAAIVSPTSAPAGRIVEAPTRFDLRGFNESNRGWIQSMAALQRDRFRVQRETVAVRLKASRLDMELDDLFRIESAAPSMALILEPFSIRKNILPEPSVEAELVDVGFYVQPSGTCGYCFTDVGHRTDSCWVTF